MAATDQFSFSPKLRYVHFHCHHSKYEYATRPENAHRKLRITLMPNFLCMSPVLSRHAATNQNIEYQFYIRLVHIN